MILRHSQVSKKVLNYFFLNIQARRYVNELAKLLAVDPKNLYRKLRELEQEGILQSEFWGKQRYYSLNKKYPLLKDYRHIFLRTIGFEKQLTSVLQKISGVKVAYLYGSYAKNKMDASSDIDVLAVGKHSSLVLQRAISQLQKQVSREINVINLTPAELAAKKRTHNPFIKHIFSGKYLKIL